MDTRDWTGLNVAEKLKCASELNAQWRQRVECRLRARIPGITDAAIRDMRFRHAIRDTEREIEIAERGLRRRLLQMPNLASPTSH